MAPKKPDTRPTRRPVRSTTARTADSSSPEPQPITQDGPATNRVPRPATWEPVNLRDKEKWTINDPEYFDEVSGLLASLFDRRPKGWRTYKRTQYAAEFSGDTEKPLPKPTLEDIAKTHAYYGRRKVHTLIHDGNGWSDEAGFDDSWLLERLLGAGAFGRVGLWVRRDENGQIIDEMAIKEQDYEETCIWDKGVPEEAIYNKLMNRDGIENIQQMRGFKSFRAPADNPVLRYAGEYRDRRWRYYFEYAPYGSLERLITRYRAWNQYLPESFLWHVFDSLAQILVTFNETAPDVKEHKIGMVRAADRLVHFDIKPDNIFLGYEQPFNGEDHKYGGHQSNVYPMVKIGDFGVSSLTSDKDRENPWRLWGTGTRYYMPPEQTHYGAGFPVPPNGEYVPLQNELGQFTAIETREGRDNPTGTTFGQPMNVWGVGKVMYDLATLSHRYDYAALSTQDPRDYEQWNHNAIEDFQVDPFTESNCAKAQDDPSPSPYSRDLMNLIEQCMKPATKDRIKAQEVKAITEKILTRYGSGDGQQVNEKVYFRGNEINNMPLGREDFPMYDGRSAVIPARQNDWSDIDQLMSYPDPNEPELKLPRWLKKLSEYKTHRRTEREQAYNKYWLDHCRLEDGKVVFQDRPAAPTTAQQDSNSNNATTTDAPEIPDSQDDDQVKLDVAAPDAVPVVAPDANDQSSGEDIARPPTVKSPPRKAAAKKPATVPASGSGVKGNDNKKGAKSKTKPAKAATGAGVKKGAAKKPTATKAPAKNGAAKKPAAQAAPQAAAAPRRQRLPRNAKKDVPAGRYKT